MQMEPGGSHAGPVHEKGESDKAPSSSALDAHPGSCDFMSEIEPLDLGFVFKSFRSLIPSDLKSVRLTKADEPWHCKKSDDEVWHEEKEKHTDESASNMLGQNA